MNFLDEFFLDKLDFNIIEGQNKHAKNNFYVNVSK